LNIQQSPQFVQITAVAAQQVAPNAGKIDVAQFNFTTQNQSTLSFGYVHGAAQGINNPGGQATDAQITEFFFFVRSLAIFEFVNNDGEPGFQQTNGSNADQGIGFYDLSNPSILWNPIVLTSTVLTGPTGSFKVSTISASTADDVFFVRYTVTEHPIMINGVRISPDKSKIDFGIKWYNPKHVKAPWTSGPFPNGNVTFPNAQVGYVAAAFSAALFAAFHNGTATNAPSGLQFGAGAVVGNFTWAPTANVTVNGVGVTGVVYAHVTDNSGMVSAGFVGAYSFKFIFFAFEGSRPDYVYWDPVAGADIDYNLLDAKAGSGVASLAVSFATMFITLLLALH